MLIQQFHSLLERGWRSAFPGKRSQKRAIQHAIALPCVFGRRTISRTLGALGRWDQDWSADYKMFSRCRWKPERLFDPVIDEYLERYPKSPVIAAIDDTKLRKTGRKIAGASWHRDPLSPAFHMNFMYGLRFRSEEHTSELQSRLHLVCRLLLEKKKKNMPTRLPLTVVEESTS